MRTGLPQYTRDDYEADIARDTAKLETETDPRERGFIEARIRAARAYVNDPEPSFKW